MNMHCPTPASPAFNLLDEPWIPVLYADGRSSAVGLREVFAEAGRIVAIAEPSPPSLVAIHRLLLAILHRAVTQQFGRWNDRDRAVWYDDGLPQAAVEHYLEQWRENFWLLGGERPFMQVPALAQAEETLDKFKPWTQIALGRACGNTPVVFDHMLDDSAPAITAADAARTMLGFLQFTPGGLVKVFRSADNAGPLANTAAIMPVGNSLARTLVLSLHPAPETPDSDRPAWECSPPTVAELTGMAKPSTGPCDRYTRLSRSILLKPEPVDSGLHVRHLRFGAGLALLEDVNAPDPMAAFRGGSSGPVRMTFADGRPLWRDLAALLPELAGPNSKPAAAVAWAADLQEIRGDWDSDVPVLVAGLRSDQAKLVRWRVEHVHLPVAGLCKADVAAVIADQLKRADDFYQRLRLTAISMLAAALPDSKSKETRARARSILETSAFPATFFAAAERGLGLLLKAVGEGDTERARDDWTATLRNAAATAWPVARALLGHSAAALRAEALAHPKYQQALASIADALPDTADNQPTEEARS
ncbi:type I-E CRISPR-associated protein Cse1/CasA [Rubrivivax gelatinosus]|uniref:CRISPR-associated protein, Cse1 family n=1 Tax=Rubrivivax gelatinosus (strain NBRC 100245 / IL144) TaxID=983917 RepID=I0HLZ6_RUBGI|nr:type I-E CRISPR-associated protein Cse1/CasA [Rubrivivax gelatinosus]BAL94033.1 CRISPR-associated protein, Cse1 family [Rubrivivax gelatinosus IL144]